MKEVYTIGLDVGTSGCKAIIVDNNGIIIDKAVEEYPLYTPNPGWSEQNPEDWWQAAVNSICRLLEENDINPDAVKGIGLSGQMHGLVAVDADDKVLRPAILWNDQRTAKQCRDILNAVGGKEELIKYTNNTMLPGYTAGKILWLREHEPQIYDRAEIFLNPKDYIRFKFTGVYATEVSDASGTGLFDVEHRRWNNKLLDILDISKELLPPCYESTDVTGKIRDRVAEEIGLNKGLPVVGGGGDAVTQTTGTGLIKEGILGTTIGTAGIVAMGLDNFKFNQTGKLQLFCNNAPDKWHIMGVNLSAGGAYQWYRDKLCRYEKKQAEKTGDDIYDILEEEINATSPGSKNLIFLPYLIGERCPHPDPLAKGAFIGLTLRHTHADLTRAVQEGVIYNLRQIYDLILSIDPDLKVSEIRTSGGGALSPGWRQIQADIFQLPVKTMSGSSEGGAYGAALLAGVGTGIRDSVEEAVSLLKVETETLPDPDNAEIYDNLYGVYKELYTNLKGSFEQIAVFE
ncbi:MAG: xylulokinase [Halanaerobiales bacterium]